jgi:hypothetical protein
MATTTAICSSLAWSHTLMPMAATGSRCSAAARSRLVWVLRLDCRRCGHRCSIKPQALYLRCSRSARWRWLRLESTKDRRVAFKSDRPTRMSACQQIRPHLGQRSYSSVVAHALNPFCQILDADPENRCCKPSIESMSRMRRYFTVLLPQILGEHRATIYRVILSSGESVADMELVRYYA